MVIYQLWFKNYALPVILPNKLHQRRYRAGEMQRIGVKIKNAVSHHGVNSTCITQNRF